MLLLARDEDGEAMTDAELRDELVTLLVAGHETTATGLAWAFELLLRNRPCSSACAPLAEGDNAYLDAVVKETLRAAHRRAGGRARRPRSALRARRLRDPAGIEINPRSQRSTAAPTATPSPTEFRPERFLGDDPPDTYTWIPFGGGTRRCLGASFATFEMRVVIARVLERAQLGPSAAAREGRAQGRHDRPERGGVGGPPPPRQPPTTTIQAPLRCGEGMGEEGGSLARAFAPPPIGGGGGGRPRAPGGPPVGAPPPSFSKPTPSSVAAGRVGVAAGVGGGGGGGGAEPTAGGGAGQSWGLTHLNGAG